MVGVETVEEFTTPDRGPATAEASNKEKAPKNTDATATLSEAATAQPPKLVTPAESMDSKQIDTRPPPLVTVSTESESPTKEDTADDEDKERTDSPSGRSLVSRRGGRCGASPPPPRATDSPKKEPVLEFKTYRSPSRKKPVKEEEEEEPNRATTPPTEPLTTSTVKSSPLVSKPAKASLKSEETKDSSDNENQKSEPLSNEAAVATSPLTTSAKAAAEEAKKSATVTFSPKPPTREPRSKTPTRSPTSSHFQSLPSLDDANLKSPVGFILSPHPHTPSAYKTIQESPRDLKKDRERFVATPTDFALDGKGHSVSNSFDASNVLAWLQSPTANGLFSPGGGLASIMNTPRGKAKSDGPHTPRTPTVSTSFFFSDVASLPRGGDLAASPKPEKRRGGYSNIICISPLASSKSRNGSYHPSANTPINYKDVFASPEGKSNPQSLPLLEESPTKASKKSGGRPSLDAMHMAERDLMEDEDLSVLLQLAANTPKGGGTTHVFRTSQSSGTNRNKDKKGGDNDNEKLPSLQLPIIGGREGESGGGARLARKSTSREHADADDFVPPTLGIRSSSSGNTAKEVYLSRKDAESKEEKSEAARKASTNKKTKTPSHPPSYPMPPHYHPDSVPPYYAMPGMPPGPPGGSMRVVVGGPPPQRKPKSPSRPPPHGATPYGDGSYPPPGSMPYPHHYHHPGVPPHMAGMGVPYHPHYPPPPPRHMPMYGAQQPPPKSTTTTVKKAKPSKAKPTKRAATTPKGGSATKKQRKSPSSASKRKSRSPQSAEKGDRNKSAATIAAVNAASGGKNDKAAALAAAILRGVTMRPSGKWQAQLYFAGKSRYIGVFDTREKAALAYEIAREKLKSDKANSEAGGLTAKATETMVNAARKAAFEGVNERDPRLSAK